MFVTNALTKVMAIAAIVSMAVSAQGFAAPNVAVSITSATWQDPHLRGALGQVSATSRVNGWMPLNLGVETSNASVPVFAIGPKGTLYLANSVGMWRYADNHWQLMRTIPGTGMRYAVAMTVSTSGILYLATTGSPDCLWKLTDRGWISLSHSHSPFSNVRLLTWSPQGHLLVETNIFPKTSSAGMGAAPMPSLGLFEYDGGVWRNVTGLLRGQDTRFVRSLAWSMDGKLAVAADNGVSIEGALWWTRVYSAPVNDLAWWNGVLVAATNHGLLAYQDKQWKPVSGAPRVLRGAIVTHLDAVGANLLIQAQNPADNSTSVWLDANGVWSQAPYHAVGVHYAGVSPQGIPTLEVEGNPSDIELWQSGGGRWKELRLPKAATTITNELAYLELKQYFPQNVTWSLRGELTVGTDGNGVWQWDGKRWTMVGGPIDDRYPYSTGDIAYLPNGTLAASVREEIPPPPATPGMLHHMIWLYSRGHWAHLRLPSGVPENLGEESGVAGNGDIALVVNSGKQIWVHHARHWSLIADKSILPSIDSSNDKISFTPEGQLAISIAGFSDPSENGIYEQIAGKWKQILANPSWLRKKDTYWLFPTWLADGSIVMSVMNDEGYHLWHYSHGKWEDLGLNNQRIEKMFVLPGNWLCAVSDAYVCWVRKMS